MSTLLDLCLLSAGHTDHTVHMHGSQRQGIDLLVKSSKSALLASRMASYIWLSFTTFLTSCDTGIISVQVSTCTCYGYFYAEWHNYPPCNLQDLGTLLASVTSFHGISPYCLPAGGMSLRKVSYEASRYQEKMKPLTWRSVSSEDLQ